MKKAAIFITLLLLSSMLVYADLFSLSLIQNKTDNLFQNSLAESDQVSNLSFYLDKDFSRFSIFTQGGFSYLRENPEAAYYSQQLGVDHLVALNKTTALYFSLEGQGTYFKSYFSDFNYISLDFFSALKSYLTPTSILKSNYSFMYKNYKYSIFDFFTHTLQVSVDKYFQSRTTLKAELNWGYKYFPHPFQSTTSDLSIENQKGPQGKGKGKTMGKSYYQENLSGEKGGRSIQVFSLGGVIAQGIGNRVGLRVSAMRQFNLKGENPFAYIEEYFLIENPSYDSYSWDGSRISGLITGVIPWNLEIKIGYTYHHRKYPGIESLSSEGIPIGITRLDKVSQLEVRVQKDFRRFNMFFSYVYIDSRSNDSFFEWDGQFFSAGIEWNVFYGEKR